VTNTRQKLN